MKVSREPRKKRASPGEGDKVSFRLRKDLVEMVSTLAVSEGIDRSEWFRRAVSERASRQVDHALSR